MKSKRVTNKPNAKLKTHIYLYSQLLSLASWVTGSIRNCIKSKEAKLLYRVELARLGIIVTTSIMTLNIFAMKKASELYVCNFSSVFGFVFIFCQIHISFFCQSFVEHCCMLALEIEKHHQWHTSQKEWSWFLISTNLSDHSLISFNDIFMVESDNFSICHFFLHSL